MMVLNPNSVSNGFAVLPFIMDARVKPAHDAEYFARAFRLSRAKPRHDEQ
jgi:hypothetical protein